MKCPTCKEVPLTMSERQGIEIDYCPQCRGVWLDRGELDKIIEKSLASTQEAPPQHQAPSQPQVVYQSAPPYSHDHYKYKRRKSFLEELFD